MHFLTAFSETASVEQKQAAYDAIAEGRAGMNCLQHVYALLTSEHAKYPELFSLLSGHQGHSENLDYEPLGSAESLPFGWKAARSYFDASAVARPPAARGGFRLGKEILDPYHPANPSPGDVIFVVHDLPPLTRAGRLDKPERFSVKHVAVLVENDAAGRLQVASNYGYPRINGNTTSVVTLEALMQELSHALPEGRALSLRSFPIAKVPARIDAFMEQMRRVPHWNRHDRFTLEERRKLHLF